MEPLLNEIETQLTWPVIRAVTRSSVEREVWDSNLELIKSNTVLPTARHRCNIYSKGAVFKDGSTVRYGTPQLC